MRIAQIELGDAVAVGLSALWGVRIVAFGSRGGRPHLSVVVPDGRLSQTDLPGSGTVTSVTRHEGIHAVVEGEPLPRLVYAHWDPPRFAWGIDVEQDPYASAASRLWVVAGDREDGYVVASDEGHLTCVEPALEATWNPEPGLRLALPGEALVVGREQVTFFLAGPLSAGDAAPRHSAWALDDERMEEVLVEPSVDGFTDILSGLDVFIAGHRDGAPVLIDGGGRVIDPPSAQLDPEHPVVLLARGPHHVAGSHDDEGLAVVLQTMEGPELWQRSARGWRVTALPAGLLRAARAEFDSDDIWALIDGKLWHVSLD